MEEVERVRRENVYYEGEIKRLTSSDEPYEEILRTKYGYIKEGEKIIIYSSPQAKEEKKP
ncbi:MULTISPECIES: septum formation initiator family protein [Thermodesulfobacterium]|jgi:cell division protein FtsB|nr:MULTISPECIES: septum formation initiator family protein [Thermodesulfobacterium]